MDIFVPFTLNRLLGTLAAVWVVPLSDTGLTPGAPSPAFDEGRTFGV